MSAFTRREVLKYTTAAGMMVLFRPLDLFAGKTERIAVTSFAGIWEEAVRSCFVSYFEEKSGAKADVVIGGPPQWMSQIEANLEKPPIHILVNTIDLALIAGKKGLVEKIRPEKLSNFKDIPQKFTDVLKGWGTCFNYGSAGLAYNKQRIKKPPKSFQEFVDRTAKGDLRASLPNVSYPPCPQMLIWSFADVFGGNVNNVDPAFAAIKRMRENTIFYSSSTEFLNHLETGEADIGIYWDGRTWSYYDTGATWIGYINPEEGGIMNPTAVQKVKNSPDVAWLYLDAMLAPEPELKFAKMLNYPVTNSKVKYPPELEERFVPWEETRWPPFEELGKQIPQWVERWNKEIRA